MTCNVGVIAVAPVRMWSQRPSILEVDLRSSTRAHLEAAEREVRAIATTDYVPDVTTTIEEMGRHWPMEKLAASVRLVDRGRARWSPWLQPPRCDHRWSLDANTTAGLGVPRSTDWVHLTATITHPASTWDGLDRARTTLLALRSWPSRATVLACRLAGRVPIHVATVRISRPRRSAPRQRQDRGKDAEEEHCVASARQRPR
jgi:hypothetical protein